jgi:hypothetical protein
MKVIIREETITDWGECHWGAPAGGEGERVASQKRASRDLAQHEFLASDERGGANACNRQCHWRLWRRQLSFPQTCCAR